MCGTRAYRGTDLQIFVHANNFANPTWGMGHMGLALQGGTSSKINVAVQNNIDINIEKVN